MGMILSKRIFITTNIYSTRDPSVEFEYLGHGRIRNIKTGQYHDLNQKAMGHKVANGFPDCKGGLGVAAKINSEKPWAFSY